MNEKKISSYNFLNCILCIWGMWYLILPYASCPQNNVIVLVKHYSDSINGLMYMYIGIILLSQFDGNYRKFYLNALRKMILPFVIGSILLLIQKIGFSISITYLKDCITGIVFGTITENYWILYKILGIYLVIPPLNIMLTALEEKQKKQLFCLILCYYGFFSLCVIFNLKLAVSDYPFLNWIGFVVIGYLVDKVKWNKKEVHMLQLLSLFSFIVSAVEAVTFEGVNWCLDSFCMSRVGMCIGIYFYINHSRIKNNVMANKFSKYTYPCYLLFPLILTYVEHGTKKITVISTFLVAAGYFISICLAGVLLEKTILRTMNNGKK